MIINFAHGANKKRARRNENPTYFYTSPCLANGCVKRTCLVDWMIWKVIHFVDFEVQMTDPSLLARHGMQHADTRPYLSLQMAYVTHPALGEGGQWGWRVSGP